MARRTRQRPTTIDMDVVTVQRGGSGTGRKTRARARNLTQSLRGGIAEALRAVQRRRAERPADMTFSLEEAEGGRRRSRGRRARMAEARRRRRARGRRQRPADMSFTLEEAEGRAPRRQRPADMSFTLAEAEREGLPRADMNFTRRQVERRRFFQDRQAGGPADMEFDLDEAEGRRGRRRRRRARRSRTRAADPYGLSTALTDAIARVRRRRRQGTRAKALSEFTYEGPPVAPRRRRR